MFNIGDIKISSRDGLVIFDDPSRNAPLEIKLTDFPLLLDFLDSLALDRRRTFRVPASHLANKLAVSVKHQEVSYSAVPINISVAGVLLEFPEDYAPNVVVDEDLEITFSLGEQVSTVTGNVRCSDSIRYGISFEEPMPEDARDSLQAIVASVEEQWLARRIRGEALQDVHALSPQGK